MTHCPEYTLHKKQAAIFMAACFYTYHFLIQR